MARGKHPLPLCYQPHGSGPDRRELGTESICPAVRRWGPAAPRSRAAGPPGLSFPSAKWGRRQRPSPGAWERRPANGHPRSPGPLGGAVRCCPATPRSPPCSPGLARGQGHGERRLQGPHGPAGQGCTAEDGARARTGLVPGARSHRHHRRRPHPLTFRAGGGRRAPDGSAQPRPTPPSQRALPGRSGPREDCTPRWPSGGGAEMQEEAFPRPAPPLVGCARAWLSRSRWPGSRPRLQSARALGAAPRRAQKPAPRSLLPDGGQAFARAPTAGLRELTAPFPRSPPPPCTPGPGVASTSSLRVHPAALLGSLLGMCAQRWPPGTAARRATSRSPRGRGGPSALILPDFQGPPRSPRTSIQVPQSPFMDSFLIFLLFSQFLPQFCVYDPKR